MLDIDEDVNDETQVFAIGLVDQPAIERNWMAFNKQEGEEKEPLKVQFSVVNEEKMILAGPAMIPDMPIYRNDDGKEYYVAFNSKGIERINNKYFKRSNHKEFNINHNPNDPANDCYVVQSFIINSELGINTPKGFDPLPEGTWFIFVKVDNPEVWSKVKSEQIKGFSVEGVFNDKKIMDAEQELLEKVKSIIK